jgi:hypothetical protein
MIALITKDARLSWDALRPIGIAIVLYALVAFLVTRVPESVWPLGAPFRNIDEAMVIVFVVLVAGCVALPTWAVHCVAWGDRRHGAASLDAAVPVSPTRRAASKCAVGIVAAALPACLAMAIVPQREHAILAARLMPFVPSNATAHLQWLFAAGAVASIAVAPFVRSLWVAIGVSHLLALVAPVATAFFVALGANLLFAVAPFTRSPGALLPATWSWLFEFSGVVAVTSALASALTFAFLGFRSGFRFGCHRSPSSPARRPGRTFLLVVLAHAVLCISAPLFAYSQRELNESSLDVRRWRSEQVSDAALLTATNDWAAGKPVSFDLLTEATRRVHEMPAEVRAADPLAQALAQGIASNGRGDWYTKYLLAWPERLDVALRWVAHSPGDSLGLLSLRGELGEQLDASLLSERDAPGAWRTSAQSALGALERVDVAARLSPTQRAFALDAWRALRQALESDGSSPDSSGSEEGSRDESLSTEKKERPE